ncbi:hypothetical protein L195_g025391 [Trifolium pratense]|uniref:Uncharacterized protein n=1 Tax=Trifolium pratense TaxID=57577 RepID=A0A2K3NGC8_TRIPR|nr:hypothetical protein L195_g025391 [Trifolium pratense]
MKMAGPLSNSSTGGGVCTCRRAYIVAPGAGPKVGLMGRDNRPNRLNCQDSPCIVGEAVMRPILVGAVPL